MQEQHRLSVALLGHMELDLTEANLPVTDGRCHGGQQ
jgi:hypothetical protein